MPVTAVFLVGIYEKSLGYLGVSSLGNAPQQEAQFLKQSGTVVVKGGGRLCKAGHFKQCARL